MLKRITKIAKTWAFLGAIVGGISMAVAWLIGFAKIPTTTITLSTIDVRSSLAGGVSPEVGEKALSFMQGVIPQTLTGIVAVLISGIVLVVLGRIIYEFTGNLGLFRETRATKLIAVMTLGTLAVTLILAGALAFPPLTAIVALVIYTAILTGLILLGNKYLGFPIIPQD